MRETVVQSDANEWSRVARNRGPGYENSYQADVSRLTNSIAKGSIQRTQLISERIGRIKPKYPKIASHYDFVLAYSEDQGKVINRRRVDRVMSLTIEPKPTKSRDASLLGAYVIETTHNHLDEDAIWGLYMTLTQVENAFRSLKSDLGLRPIYHQLATRCRNVSTKNARGAF